MKGGRRASEVMIGRKKEETNFERGREGKQIKE